MSKNHYNTSSMKNAAETITRKLHDFNEAKDKANKIVGNLHFNWDDEAGQSYSRKYKNNAEPAMEDLSKMISQFATLMNQCSKKYGAAIDNGNARLSI